MGVNRMTLLRRTGDCATHIAVLTGNAGFSSLEVRRVLGGVRSGRVIARLFDLNQLFAHLRPSQGLVRLGEDGSRNSERSGNNDGLNNRLHDIHDSDLKKLDCFGLQTRYICILRSYFIVNGNQGKYLSREFTISLSITVPARLVARSPHSIHGTQSDAAVR